MRERGKKKTMYRKKLSDLNYTKKRTQGKAVLLVGWGGLKGEERGNS